MRTALKICLCFVCVCALTDAIGQGMPLREVLIVAAPELKDGVSTEKFMAILQKRIPNASAKNTGKTTTCLFQADRGKDNGQLLLVRPVSRAQVPGRRVSDLLYGSAGAGGDGDPRSSVKNPEAHTVYSLLGADAFQSLPSVDILGIHYLKVKADSGEAFEKFVREKMHPKVGALLPDMHLLTYKATDGVAAGSYITIFAIRSAESRDAYWPAGKPETQALKDAFKPLAHLSAELKDYLVPGSYLEPDGGAAAIFESREWTDYLLKEKFTK